MYLLSLGWTGFSPGEKSQPVARSANPDLFDELAFFKKKKKKRSAFSLQTSKKWLCPCGLKYDSSIFLIYINLPWNQEALSRLRYIYISGKSAKWILTNKMS